ncbi:MAG: DUF790 family protein [Acidobacteriota bacterium]
MLTTDLILARRYKGEIRPRYIDTDDPDHRALADSLIEIFRASVGRPRHELEAELADLLGTGTAFLLHRGLAKLLLDRCTFETEAPIEPAELRRRVFEQSAAAWLSDSREDFAFERPATLTAALDGTGLTLEDTDRYLYADLKGEQILQRWKPCDGDWLLRRYNVALAQGILLRASELTLEIGPQPTRRWRALFRKIKFFQLMHSVEGSPRRGYRIHLDGPASILKSSQRYGLQMASFLPTLLHFDDWSLDATVFWGKKRLEAALRLASDQGLDPCTRLTGQWRPDELADLAGRFRKLGSEWEISTDAALVDLGGRGVLVPDFRFRHPDGCEAFLEVFGYWNRGALENRLALLAEHGPPNLILALSAKLATQRDGLQELPGEIMTFRSRPLPRKVLERLEALRTE